MVTMKHYVGHIHDELQGEIDRRIEEIRNNLAISAAEMTRRLEGLNEFRAAFSDREKAFLTRDLMDQIVDGLREQDSQQERRLVEVERWISRAGGASEGSDARQGRQVAASNARLVALGVLVSVVLVVTQVVIALTFHQP
jgi:hypothetical protein